MGKKLHTNNSYYIEENVLKRYIEDNKQRFEVVVLPQALTGPNGIPRTYALLR